jgi:hypothetical protein
VTVSLGSGAGPLQGTKTVNVAGGVATFAGLADTKAGTITLNYSAESFTARPSTVVINPVAASKLVFQTQPSTTATAGREFDIQPVIFEEDQYDNLETADNSAMVTAAVVSGVGPLLGTVTATVTGGIATFTNLEDDKAETVTLKFTGVSPTSQPIATIVVSPAAPSQLVIQTQPSSTTTAGQPFVSQPVLAIEDQFGNAESGDNATSVTVSLGSGAGPLDGTTTIAVHGGVATFAGLADTKAGTITLNYSAESFTAGPSTVFINPAATSKLVIQTQPSTPATAGQPIATQPVVLEEDQYDNIETGDNSTPITAVLTSGNGPIHGATATVKGGVATFTSLEDDKAEPLSLKFTGAGLFSLPASSIAVNAAAATKLVVVTNQSGQVPAGTGFEIIVEAQDPFGNIDPLFSGKISLALGVNPNGETLGGTLTATAIDGIATFSGVTLDKPNGTYTLNVSGARLTTESPPAAVAPPTPGQIPTVTGETVVYSQKTNKKGKPQGKKTFTGFKIQYSIAMNQATAQIASNYQVKATIIKRVKKQMVKSLETVQCSATYDGSSNSVTLKVIGKNPFAKGGQIKIVTSSPTGVSSQLGVALSSSYNSFRITPIAKQITLG